jgi:hypothetical protein
MKDTVLTRPIPAPPAAPQTTREQPRSFFIAGLMQGARRGSELSSQDYRRVLTEMLLARFPQAVVHDPGEVMWREMAHSRDAIRTEHAALAERPVIRRSELSAPLVELTHTFHRLTHLAAECDVCVVWLPNHEPSMGTAAEMLSAHRAGRQVVSITDMRQNLAVLSCSDAIVPDVPAFEAWLDAEYGQ